MSIQVRTKHLLHCALYLTIILTFQHFGGGLSLWPNNNHQLNEIDPIKEYGQLFAWFLYSLRFVATISMLLLTPILVSNILGLILYDTFPDKVKLKVPPNQAPFICFRTVTRGDYPELVKRIVKRNLNTCLSVGLEKFVIEVVTGKQIGVKENKFVKELVVPEDYKTKSGSLYKPRKLQYCLDNNTLNDDDWIVHLDEETIVSDDSIRGIINFVSTGKHDFGAGVIKYVVDDEIVNWFTTLADTFRVADNYGRQRFQFYAFYRPLFGWKGSFTVAKSSSERAVSFEQGPDGSILEDAYFAITASSMGYSFDVIDGEMFELSPFTISDFLQQRKRWLEGNQCLIQARQIPWKNKFIFAITHYGWMTMPFLYLNLVLASLFPLPSSVWLNFLMALFGAFSMYMYIFGVVKSFSVERLGVKKFSACLISLFLVIPFNLVIENFAVGCAWFGKNKHRYYVVQKQTFDSKFVKTK